jgi:hypothetical protein
MALLAVLMHPDAPSEGRGLSLPDASGGQLTGVRPSLKRPAADRKDQHNQCPQSASEEQGPVEDLYAGRVGWPEDKLTDNERHMHQYA